MSDNNVACARCSSSSSLHRPEDGGPLVTSPCLERGVSATGHPGLPEGEQTTQQVHNLGPELELSS